jgi:hypothetical protein
MNDQLISLLERQASAQESSAQALMQIAQRLDLLIQVMAEENVAEDPDAQPIRYMDGTLCR